MSEIETVDNRKLIKYGLAVIVIAISINSFIYFIADQFDVFSDEVINPSTKNPIPVSEIIFVSIIQMVLGIMGFAIAPEITKKPVRLFRIIAIIFLLLSFSMPFRVEGANVFVIISLMLMHVVAGLLMIVVLPKYVTN
ncbi:MAG: hypothetical protein HeimC2_20010 [Candidatus Heimdallarchaeota archaeon LC_2]|nr:MAG: hypothetical protein HeimC2_20010 [Candidatus Heimdallarchaeota archaeon LC_2]